MPVRSTRLRGRRSSWLPAQAEEKSLPNFLGLLALDPETRHAPIALVLHSECFPPQARPASGSSRSSFGFRFRLMSAETDDVYDLLETGIRALFERGRLVLLAGSLLPRRSGGTAGWFPPTRKVRDHFAHARL